MFSSTDTIVAIATPPGRGGLGVVRLAGPAAVNVAQQLTGRTRPLRPRHATFAVIGDRAVDGSETRLAHLDHVVVTWFRAPHSYTGDDVVEIAAHGSPPVLRQVVERAIDAGARLAEPGEFTFRAFLNGRIDLVQAEAVADLIEAVTPRQARAAMDQLDGTLTAAIRRIDEALFDLIARLEASLDFPDEGFHFVTRADLAQDVGRIGRELDALAEDGRRGRILREGATVVLAGRPNVGKSSLFNTLAGADRAIVTEVPGTTRDVLAADVDIGGLAVTLVDTAGMREAGDVVEAEGVKRAQAAQNVAALVLVVLDQAEPLTDDDLALVAGRSEKARVIVINKADRTPRWSAADVRGADRGVVVSARTGQGVDVLRRRIVEELTGRDDLTDSPAITNVRHLALVDEARTAVGRALDALGAGATEELVADELTGARTALEAVVGRRAPDDLLHHVFSTFCIGK